MTRTRSGRSCNFELQIVHLCGSLPLLFHPSWLTVLSIEVGKFLSVTVVVAALWIAVDTLSALSKARISLGTPTRLHRQLSQAHLVAMSAMCEHTKCARGRFRGHATSGERCPDNAMQAFVAWCGVAWRSCFGSCHCSLSTKRLNHLLCKLRQNKCTLVNFRIVILKSHLLNFTLSKYCHRIFKSGVLKMLRK